MPKSIRVLSANLNVLRFPHTVSGNRSSCVNFKHAYFVKLTASPSNEYIISFYSKKFYFSSFYVSDIKLS